MRAIGIDLGTTNSVAACCDAGGRNPRILSNSVGENVTPSAVCSKDGDTLVGRAALNYAHKAPESTVLSIKRLMGRDYVDDNLARVRDRFTYQVVPGPDEDPRAHVMINGRRIPPAEISATILRRIKDDASRTLGEEVTHAVITVPAYFNEGQRAATREAGEKAGLVVKKIIDEPTAAAIAFGMDARKDTRYRILVFDMGGGTFDISILQMVKDEQGGGQYQVMQIEGDNWLGGDDFDLRIVERMLRWVKDTYGIDPSQDKRFLLLAKRYAEEAKRTLSEAEVADIEIEGGVRGGQSGPLDVGVRLTRDELGSMIEEYVSRAMKLVQEGLGKQGLTPDDITDVLLVGGATLTPLVYRSVEGMFGSSKVRRNVNPMECVALGAAILAATLEGVECASCGAVNDESLKVCERCSSTLATARSVGSTKVGEVTALALGIEAVRGDQKDVFVPIIPKGTPYPLERPMKQPFLAIGERRIVVPVYEGDDPVASRNAEQGVVDFELPEKIDVNTPVDVSFNYDRDRVITVTISVGGKFIRTETLRRNRARKPPPPQEERGDTVEDWEEELQQTVDFARTFLEQYGPFMQPAEGTKIETDIRKAEEVLAFPSETEGQRVTRVLQTDVFSAGLASQLFLADRATDSAPVICCATSL